MTRRFKIARPSVNDLVRVTNSAVMTAEALRTAVCCGLFGELDESARYFGRAESCVHDFGLGRSRRQFQPLLDRHGHLPTESGLSFRAASTHMMLPNVVEYCRRSSQLVLDEEAWKAFWDGRHQQVGTLPKSKCVRFLSRRLESMPFEKLFGCLFREHAAARAELGEKDDRTEELINPYCPTMFLLIPTAGSHRDGAERKQRRAVGHETLAWLAEAFRRPKNTIRSRIEKRRIEPTGKDGRANLYRVKDLVDHGVIEISEVRDFVSRF